MYVSVCIVWGLDTQDEYDTLKLGGPVATSRHNDTGNCAPRRLAGPSFVTATRRLRMADVSPVPTRVSLGTGPKLSGPWHPSQCPVMWHCQAAIVVAAVFPCWYLWMYTRWMRTQSCPQQYTVAPQCGRRRVKKKENMTQRSVWRKDEVCVQLVSSNQRAELCTALVGIAGGGLVAALGGEILQ